MSKQPDYLLNGKVIVKVLPSKEEKIEGIIIPSTTNCDLTEGLVILVDKQLEEHIKKGDIVVFPTGSGVGQYIGNDPHLWLNISDVWAGFSIDNE